MKRIIFSTVITALLFLPATGTQSLKAQWVLLAKGTDSLVRTGLDATYNLHYEEADSLFDEIIAAHPDHPSGYFLKALVDWWRIIPNVEVESKLERYSVAFNSHIDKTLEICQKRLDYNPADLVGLFFKGSALGYRARLSMLRNFNPTSLIDWIGAAKDGQDAYNTILKCQQLAPSNSDVLLGSGLYNYFSAYAREELPGIASMLSFLPPGDRKLGLQMLSIAARRAVYAGTEAQYSLAELQTNLEKNYEEGLRESRVLYERYPDNPVFHKFYARNLFYVNNWVEADTAWHEVMRRIKARQPGYELSLGLQATYYLGDIRLRYNDLANAEKLFGQTLDISRRIGADDESGWVIMATLELGYVYDKQGRRNDAVKMYNRVLSMKNYFGSHSKAEPWLSKPYR